MSNKKDDLEDRYSTSKFNFTLVTKAENEEENAYIALIDIANFSDLKANFSQEELDMINSKISEKIISYLDKDEQVYKNDEDEYIAMIFGKDDKHVLRKLNYIANILSEISYNTYKIETLVGASSCIIEGSFDINEAQKNARIALEKANSEEKAVIE